MEPELIYEGKGAPKPRHDPERYTEKLPEYESPQHYYAAPDLAEAVNTAMFLNQPLLITGAPGAGKTQLAYSIAWEFDLPLRVFNTKMNSSGHDLFYRYDSLLHFQDSHDVNRTLDPKRYVFYSALGRAILESREPSEVTPYTTAPHAVPTRSVVLIDEIDKAPRDFPNDILYETERLRFRVLETNWPEFQVNDKLRPIVIFTSNQERNMPDAFLRRCIFYYIPLPDPDTLWSIVERRLRPPRGSSQERLFRAARDKYVEVRGDQALLKKPSTAEMLSWMQALARKGISAEDIQANSSKLLSTWPVLAKTKEDLERLQKTTPLGSPSRA